MNVATSVGDFLFAYWWLLFPLAWFLAMGWGSFMRYKRTQAKIDLLKSYAASGKEPPAGLMEGLDESEDRDWSREEGEDKHPGGGHAFLVILFAGLAGVFAFAGYSGMLGGVDTELYFVAMILGVLSVAFLASAIFRKRRND